MQQQTQTAISRNSTGDQHLTPSFGAQTVREDEYAQVMFSVNMIAPFPLDEGMIILWVRTLNRLRPWVSPNHLQRTIDAFITEKLEWDNSKQIQNIFDGILRIKRED